MSTEPVTDDDAGEAEPLPLRPAHPRVPGAVHRGHRRRCWTSARSRGATPTAATGSPPGTPRSSSWPGRPSTCPTTTTRPTSGGATRASRSRPPRSRFRGGFLEMDPPEQRYYRQLLNPYLSPAAVARWTPLVDEIVRASLNEKIETGRIDFVDDLANIVPAVLTLGMLGIPLENWDIYVEPIHASVYTPPNSPDIAPPAGEQARHARRHDGPARGDQGEPAARADPRARDGGDQRHRAAGLRAARDHRAAHRGRVRHHHRADRARPRVAVGAPGPAGAAVGRAGHAAQPGHRGVPALLHPGSRRRAHDLGRLRDRGPAVQGGRAALAVVGDVQPRPRGLPQPQRGRPGPHRQPAPQLRPRHPPLHRVQRGPHGVQADGHRGARPDARLRLRPGRAPSTTRRSASSRA